MSVKDNPLSIGQEEADLFMADAAIKKAETLGRLRVDMICIL